MKYTRYFNFSTLIGIAGILIGVYLYQISKETYIPTYKILKEPTLIFNKDLATPSIKIINNDSVIVNKNVYVTNIVLWNDGNQEIKIEDVRKPLRLVPLNGANIIDYSIVNQSHADISKFKLTPQKDGSLLIKWDYFDPGFAVEFQLIYTGSSESKIEVEGHVFNNTVTKYEGIVKKKDEKNRVDWELIITGILIIALLISSLKANKKGNPESMPVWFTLFIYGSMLIGLMFFYYFSNFNYYSLPF